MIMIIAHNLYVVSNVPLHFMDVSKENSLRASYISPQVPVLFFNFENMDMKSGARSVIDIPYVQNL